MSEQQSPHQPEKNLSPEEQIAAKDRLFAISEYPLDETTLDMYPVKRTNGDIENGWMLVGEGVHPQTGEAVGKFMKYETAVVDGQEVRRFATKHLPMEAQKALRSAERERSYERRMIVAEEIGQEAIEKVVETDISGREPYIEPEGEQARIFSAEDRRHLREAIEREKNDPYGYLREALPPVVRPAGDAPKQSYDHLFNRDDAQYQQSVDRIARAPKTPEDRQREYYEKFVTEENREQAREYLGEAIRANPAIGEVIRDAGLDPNSLAAVDAIRENPDVRYAVAKYLVQKLDSMIIRDPRDFGWRIEQNSLGNLKVDPQTGRKMTSRLYAVDMALKMIGGEFSEKQETGTFARDESGRVVDGQHRHAARTILTSY